MVRPLLPSDELDYRDFFYSLRQETIFMRFFHPVTTFSHKKAQAHWAAMDYRNRISLIGRVQSRGNKEIVAIGTYAMIDEEWAEVAFVVRDDFQHQGVACHIFKELEKVAIKNGFKGFLATTLSENTAMINLCKKCFTDIVIENNEDKEDEMKIWIHFTP